jgi:hypothetical protein
MSHHNEYRQWPFLTEEEFELACAFFDQKYVNAKLGPTRKIFKIRTRRTLTTGASYLEIIRLLRLPEDDDELSLVLGKLTGVGKPDDGSDVEIDMVNEDADQVRRPAERSARLRESHRKHFKCMQTMNLRMIVLRSIACTRTNLMLLMRSIYTLLI